MWSLAFACALALQTPPGAAPPAPAAPAAVAAPAPSAPAAGTPGKAGKAGKAGKKAPPPARERVIVVDDRAVKDQAPAAFLERVLAELNKRKGMRATRLSAMRAELDAKEDKALAGCGDDAGCLATAARALGADTVVLVRVTRRDGEEARFVATTRINALRPQMQDDSGGIAGTEKDALPLVTEQVAELFPDAELR